ncbi:MAG: alpha/beta hydrolase [Akkermansiaceae bacterium]
MYRLFSLVFLAIFSIAQGADTKPEATALWEKGKAPDGEGGFTDEVSNIFLYHPKNPNGTIAVVCPGGGYGGLVMGGEGHGIAKWLGESGISAVVLKYRLPAGRSSVPLLDAQRAIRFARMNAKKWNCDPSRIGIIGFSAGGHLAATAATQFEKGDGSSDDPFLRESCRPDFAILVYPVITMGEFSHGGSRNRLLGKHPSKEMVRLFSAELQVTKETPPVFLAHAKDDSVVPIENSQIFHKAMKENEVNSKLMELPSGNHGLNGYKGPMWDAWQDGSIEWLREQRLIPRKGDE